MFDLWIPITIGAAFFQNLRSALQKHLKSRLSNSGAAYARFFYALPFALIYVWALHRFANLDLPTPHAKFFLYCTLGGVSQILFTVFLLWMFSFRSFAVGTTFSKLEVIMIAVLGTIVLGDTLNVYAVVAIVISAFGVIVLTIEQTKITRSTLLSGLKEKATLIGLACAAWLGASVVFFRGASLSLNHDNIVMAAAYTLGVSLIIQSTLMGVYLILREPGEFSRVVKNWNRGMAVGVVGMLASVGWFTAFTLQNASFVRALGQVELVFTFLSATLIFNEKVSRMEIFGIVLVVAAILLIVLAG